MACRAADDSLVEREPSRHVDYLSHPWREEDVWSSWRYISARRDEYESGHRLENAAWRSWARIRFDLGSFPAEALNWQKDIDVTWLYGPLQVLGDEPDDRSSTSSLAPSSPATSNSSCLIDKKPILKKRTISQSILQRPPSTHTFLRLANALIKAQDGADGGYVADYPVTRQEFEKSLGGVLSDSSMSNLFFPESNATVPDKRHISFSNEVAQCVAVEDDDEPFDGDYYGYYQPATDCSVLEDDETSDDGVMMARHYPERPPLSSQSTPRSSFSSDSRIIAHLPSTTLKYRPDTPEPKQEAATTPRPVRPTLSRSSSAETLRPSNYVAAKSSSHGDFFLDEEYGLDEDWNTGWDTDWKVQQPKPVNPATSSLTGQWFGNSKAKATTSSSTSEQGKYHSSAGVFMPFGYGDSSSDGEYEWSDEVEEGNSSRGVIDRVIDTVNTARDIAHVIWNVGWRG
ncbi:protein phosphatase regulator [Microsporum audouinii]